MKKKPTSGIVSQRVPADVLAAAFRVADARCGDFIQHWASLQCLPAASRESSIQQLCRNVYLQGMVDGALLGDRMANRDALAGLS